MQKTNFTIRALLFFSVLFFLSGCGKDSDMMADSKTSEEYFSTYPPDQATDARLDERIQLIFLKSVDPKAVEVNFHLISRKVMPDSLCRFGKNMQHGDMSMAMMDSMKMNHLMNNHSTGGRFSWNTDFTRCIFTPDSLMKPNSDYMMHFGGEMMRMMKERMSGMGMMNRMGSGMTKRQMMWHFTTMDTLKTGGGHLGHH